MTINNEQENARRKPKDYKVGELVYICNDSRRKLASKLEGPFLVEQVHTNGTITIRRNGGVFERINIRRVYPKEDEK